MVYMSSRKDSVVWIFILTVTPDTGRSPPFLVQTAVGQGSAVTLTDKTIGGSSCWMKENPRHGSASVAYELTIARGTVREGGLSLS